MNLPKPDPFLIFIQCLVKQGVALSEDGWKRVRWLWLEGERDPNQIVERVRQGRLWER